MNHLSLRFAKVLVLLPNLIDTNLFGCQIYNTMNTWSDMQSRFGKDDMCHEMCVQKGFSVKKNLSATMK